MNVSISAESIKTAAIVLGGLYFLFKFALGYLMINVSLAATVRRQHISEDTDLLVVSTKISKGDRECLQLNELALSASEDYKFISSPKLDFTNSYAP